MFGLHNHMIYNIIEFAKLQISTNQLESTVSSDCESSDRFMGTRKGLATCLTYVSNSNDDNESQLP